MEFLGLRSGVSNTLDRNPVRVRNIFQRALAVLTKCLKFQIVLMIDSLQWCDNRSLTHITRLMRSDFNILLIMQSRPLQEISDEAVAFDVNSLMRMQNVKHVVLGTMDLAGTSEMIGRAIGCVPHGSLTEEIHRNSGGVPMVIDILTQALKAPGILRIIDGIARLHDGVKLRADEKDLGSLVSSQFDELPSKFQLILKVASVSGFSFSLSYVVKVCNDISDTDTRNQITVEEAIRLVKKHDTYDFLHHPPLPTDDTESNIYFF
ncbi:hypothetical protein HDU67_005190, partial [Dinochytrium kinnereticum]